MNAMPFPSLIVRYLYIPFMIGLLAIGYHVVSYHLSYLWLAVILLVALAVTFGAEKISPWYGEWNDAHDDTVTNIWHWIAYESGTVVAILSIPIITWLFPFQGYWPTQWPLLAQFILAFILADFSFMALHYLSHRIPLLWRLHAVHHGAKRLHGFNGIVRHPLHQSIDLIIGTAPLVIIGMPLDVAVILGLAVSLALTVQHSNVAFELGPLKNYLAIGKVHHLHHVNWGKEGDCNFGLFFSHWDKLFGTFQAEPSRPITSKDMGIDEVPNFPKSFIEHLIFPFIYRPGRGQPKRYQAPK